MKRKLIAVITVIMMVVTLVPTFAFAGGGTDARAQGTEGTDVVTQENELEIVLEDAEDVADIVEDATGTNDIIDDVQETGDEFLVEGEDSEVSIPKDGDGEVSLDSQNSESISMKIPKMFSEREGELAGEGTVAYTSENLDASAAVQGIQEKQDDIVLDGFRSLITIENADAPHDYSFEFDLPNGCILVEDGEYINIVDGNNMVVDENGENAEPEVIGVIDPAWAKDANGESVNTNYDINGNTKKCVWKDDIYKVYSKNVGTGKLYYRHKEHHWSWNGYKKNSKGK